MGKFLLVKVFDSGKRDKVEYKNKIVINDPNLLAIVFQDLIHLYNAPIKKAVTLIGKDEEKNFPFFS